LKLLCDHNLAPRLVGLLGDVFPSSQHVRDVGLSDAADLRVWEHAKSGGFAIVSKDADFRQLSFLFGAPPKVVWLRVGNRSTTQIEAILRAHAAAIQVLEADPVAALLVVTA
jgi:predicted nuclease of predicted toxin-antitoxin system